MEDWKESKNWSALRTAHYEDSSPVIEKINTMLGNLTDTRAYARGMRKEGTN